MKRYFFHVLNGKTNLDDVGVELADMDKVRAEAIRAAGQMLSDGKQEWTGEAWRMVVTDADSNIVFGVNFSVDRHGI
ncbi:DUF6894 family protein [Neorhizobium alkalisoli]|uniref:DUF6894 family protein n=1 Tax=Neorhizobium alkalisoli TaxID=528178 RepID=UPI000CF90F48|nr:hypothetical protein [Neorhizobium alkalisoli]